MGHFDIFVQDAKGYNDADFISAQKNGTIDNLLASLPVKQEVHTNNLVLQMFYTHYQALELSPNQLF